MSAAVQAGRAKSRPLLGTPLRVAALSLAALGADVAFDPAHRHVPLCPFRAATGWWCPLCGGLRSADALAHLQVWTAVRDNVLLVAAVPLLALWWLNWAQRRRRGEAARSLPRAVVVAVIVIAVAFTVIRNLPFAAGLRPG